MPNQIYVPLEVAAKKHNVKETVLTRLIAAGMIEAKEEAGETLVAIDKGGSGNDTEPQSKDDIIAVRYIELQGRSITLSQAAKKYKVPRGTIRDWVYNSYVTPTDPGSYPMLFSEAEVAYCAEIYHERKKTGTGFYGAPLLNNKGLPYKLKRPDLAQYRREKRTTVT